MHINLKQVSDFRHFKSCCLTEIKSKTNLLSSQIILHAPDYYVVKHSAQIKHSSVSFLFSVS